MKIAFYLADTWDWRGEDLEGRGLGGTEAALVFLARELARHHRVTVYNGTRRPGRHAGVTYLPVGLLERGGPWDAFVSLSYTPGIRELPARVKVHWSLEDDQVRVKSYRDYLPHLDCVFALSPFHAELLSRRFAIPPGKLHTGFLGVSPAEYAAPARKVPGRLIYCSVPDRGAEHLAPIFGMIREAYPAASLVVTGDFRLWGRSDPGDAPYRATLAGVPGVRYLGKLPRRELVRLQGESVVHLYPCLVQELFCLASLECQAAGAPTVAPRIGALATTVADGVTGILLERSPHADPEGHRAFAEAVLALLRDPQRLQAMGEAAHCRALSGFSWEAVAGDWTAKLAAWSEGR
ncbi:MAG: glycosyltransferase family 4 protein [Thermaerobacter sp.]|nr:glycosyltransferase family 4 protein [Thermaerobacter sp.]